VVVHAAWYVSPQMARERGAIGRSEGCFAFSQADLGQVMERLGPGRLIVAGKL
jgi:L,D-peptidoglycan transpeptidase YkuD (ErfK/YbiS/YcfS/YnhG family)